jgi:hypothetical protein
MAGSLMTPQLAPDGAQRRFGDCYFMSKHLERIAIVTVLRSSMLADEFVQIISGVGVKPPEGFTERTLGHRHKQILPATASDRQLIG